MNAVKKPHYNSTNYTTTTSSSFTISTLCVRISPSPQGLIPELVDYNLRRGSPAMRGDVRHLLCLLTKDNPVSTEELNALLVQRIVTAIRGHMSNPSFVSIII